MHQKFAYTLAKFCRHFPCSRTEAYREIQRGHLTALKRGRNVIISAEAANAWLAGLPVYGSAEERRNL